MIRINLAKPYGMSRKRGGGKKSLIVISILLFLALVGAYYCFTAVFHSEWGAVTAMLSSESGSKSDDTGAISPAAPKTEAPTAPVVPLVRPPTKVRSNMVENVVRELGRESRAVSKLETPYADMTTAEKINYEALFARNVFDMITRCTPPGIKFSALEIENFQTIYASGAGLSRQMVQEMFSAFRAQRGELLPRPHSNIKDDPGRGGAFAFTIVHKPNFGLEVADPFQALDHLGFRESLAHNLRNFSRIAGESGFKMSAAPSQISVDRVGSYRRIVYRAAGTSTYKDFHAFVLALYNAKVPCAFKKISITPVRGEQVRVNAEILFTVKE